MTELLIAIYLTISIGVTIVLIKEDVFLSPTIIKIPLSFLFSLFFPFFLLILAGLAVDKSCQKYRVFKEGREISATFDIFGYDERNVLIFSNKFTMKGTSIKKMQKNFAECFENDMRGKNYNLVTIETNIFNAGRFRGRNYRACTVKDGKLFHCDRTEPFQGEFFQ